MPWGPCPFHAVGQGTSPSNSLGVNKGSLAGAVSINVYMPLESYPIGVVDPTQVPKLLGSLSFRPRAHLSGYSSSRRVWHQARSHP